MVTLVGGVNPLSVSVQSGKTYEEEFDIETRRAHVRALPSALAYIFPSRSAKDAALHGAQRSPKRPKSSTVPLPRLPLPLTAFLGYDQEIQGDTAEKRLDIRCAQRTDKFCK